MADGLADEVIQADIDVVNFFSSVFFDYLRHGKHDEMAQSQQTCHN